MIKGTKEDFIKAINNRDVILEPIDGIYGSEFETFLNDDNFMFVIPSEDRPLKIVYENKPCEHIMDKVLENMKELSDTEIIVSECILCGNRVVYTKDGWNNK